MQMLREDRLTETEFVTISYRESVEAMFHFAAMIPGEIPSPRSRRRVSDRVAGTDSDSGDCRRFRVRRSQTRGLPEAANMIQVRRVERG